MGNILILEPVPKKSASDASASTQSSEEDKLKQLLSPRNLSIAPSTEIIPLRSTATQTDSHTTIQMDYVQAFAIECKKLRNRIQVESLHQKLSPSEFLHLNEILRYNEERLLCLVKTLNEELAEKLQRKNDSMIPLSPSLSSSNKPNPLFARSESSINLTKSETQFVKNNKNMELESESNIIQIKLKVQPLRQSTTRVMDEKSNIKYWNWMFQERPDRIWTWVEINYEYNMSTQSENISIVGSLESVLPTDYEQDDSIFVSEKTKKLKYFLKYLDYILNNSRGIVAWNSLIIRLRDEPNTSSRLQIIDLDIHPSRLIFQVNKFKRVQIYRTPKKFKIQGIDSQGIKKAFKLYENPVKMFGYDTTTGVRDLEVTTPGNGTVILHFPQT